MYQINVVDDQKIKIDGTSADTLARAEREAGGFADGYSTELFDMDSTLFPNQIMFVEIYEDDKFIKALKVEVVE